MSCPVPFCRCILFYVLLDHHPVFRHESVSHCHNRFLFHDSSSSSFYEGSACRQSSNKQGYADITLSIRHLVQCPVPGWRWHILLASSIRCHLLLAICLLFIYLFLFTGSGSLCSLLSSLFFRLSFYHFGPYFHLFVYIFSEYKVVQQLVNKVLLLFSRFFFFRLPES